jgi:hypothetical protein
MSSLLFRKVVSGVSAPLRRNISTTTVKRSGDPLIGHIEQEARPGAVKELLLKFYQFNFPKIFIYFFFNLIRICLSRSTIDTDWLLCSFCILEVDFQCHS